MKKQKRKNKKLTNDLFLFSAIEPESVEEIIEDIINIRKKNKKPINLYINSPGGFCSDGFALIDIIEQNFPIRTIAVGEICSMACPIFLSGKKGERYISSNTFAMFHPVHTGASDYLSFVESRIKNSKVIEKMYDDFVLGHCKMPKNIYNKAKNSELWLNAKECLDYGIADKLYKGSFK